MGTKSISEKSKPFKPFKRYNVILALGQVQTDLNQQFNFSHINYKIY